MSGASWRHAELLLPAGSLAGNFSIPTADISAQSSARSLFGSATWLTTSSAIFLTAERLGPRLWRAMKRHVARRSSQSKAMSILPRFGAVGKHGSIAVVERFHRTLKEILRLITVPEHQPDFEHEVVSSSTGTMSTALTKPLAARHPTRCTFHGHQPANSLESNLADAGHVRPLVRSRTSIFKVILVTRSTWRSTASRTVAIYR